jgi:DNA polymerase-3 subunit chi
VLISLASAIPSFFSRFGRVADVVGATEEAKQQARERFRFYRERGYSLQTHSL